MCLEENQNQDGTPKSPEISEFAFSLGCQYHHGALHPEG